MLFEDRNLDVDADGDPDLSAHSIEGRPIEGFDPKVLLDPFEEELDLPAQLVEVRNGLGGQLELIGEEQEILAVVRIDVMNPAQLLRVILAAGRAAQAPELIASNAAI